jgi:hypothetical protein
LVKCAKESAGKRYGSTGTKIGNASLKWAFSEAAVLFLRNNPAGQKYLARLEKKHGKGKALTVLAHTWARAVYYMLKRETAFDLDKFFHEYWSGAGEPGASLDHDGMSLGTALQEPLMHCVVERTGARRPLSLIPAPLIGHSLRLPCLQR